MACVAHVDSSSRTVRYRCSLNSSLVKYSLLRHNPSFDFPSLPLGRRIHPRRVGDSPCDHLPDMPHALALLAPTRVDSSGAHCRGRGLDICVSLRLERRVPVERALDAPCAVWRSHRAVDGRAWRYAEAWKGGRPTCRRRKGHCDQRRRGLSNRDLRWL